MYMILNDIEIAEYIESCGMITPSVNRTREIGGVKVISYGLGYFGYDVRLSSEFKSIDRQNVIIDPKNIPEHLYEPYRWFGDMVLEPHETILASTVEYFNMPADVCGICLGKSTYARCGLLVNATPLEPGWCGNLTLELTNLNKQNSIKLYVGEGIAQILFFRGHLPLKTYEGSYQFQSGTTIPIV